MIIVARKLTEARMRGFTLIEVLVVTAITVMMTGLLVLNFSRTRVDMNQTTLLVKDAIREAQSLALSGAVFGRGSGSTSSRCGYGIHFQDSGYVVYAGPLSDPANCVEARYGFTVDSEVVRRGTISNSVLEIVMPAPDIFFEPPNPKTYFIGSGANATTIVVRRKGTSDCPSADCRQINVTTSGQIQ